MRIGARLVPRAGWHGQCSLHSAEAPMPDAKSNPEQHRVETAIRLMASFADRTGLSSERPSKRYLWTDALAVCNFLALARLTDRVAHADLAHRLIDRVHHTLGKHRPDDSRTGWISGLSDADGEAHPTRGGLRIGKPLPERRAGERFDEAVEWERDGQYFHYLTKWTRPGDRTARARHHRVGARGRTPTFRPPCETPRPAYCHRIVSGAWFGD
jgi:hypothetical protein